jgi:hypothetical protein
LREGSGNVRLAAAAALGLMQPAADTTAPELVHALFDPVSLVQKQHLERSLALNPVSDEDKKLRRECLLALVEGRKGARPNKAASRMALTTEKAPCRAFASVDKDGRGERI